MSKVLDIVPLRSLIAIADTGGFHRAASTLALTQSAVSQHVRRLEAVVGQPLVEPDGRAHPVHARRRAAAAEARRIIDAHDQALRRLSVARRRADHRHDRARRRPAAAADHDRLGEQLPGPRRPVPLRPDAPAQRGGRPGHVDLAVFVAEASERPGAPVGTLPLRWCSAPGWTPPADGTALPLVAIQEPCAIRSAALSALAEPTSRPRSPARRPTLAACSTRPAPASASPCWRWPAPRPRAWSSASTCRRRRDHLAARIREGADPEVTETVLGVLRSTLTTTLPAVAA